VYRFNRIIHDLLYDNSGWSDTLNSISSVHAVLAFFGQITVALVKLVINFFILLYKLVNRSYMSLSREMEFNADNVAVSVTGSKAIIGALYRLEFGQEAFNYTAQGTVNYGKGEAIQPKNFFTLMQRNLQTMATLNKLEIQNGLPVINTELAKKNFLDNRIVYKDIWATHPPTEEREKNANRIFIESVEVKDSPWLLFNSPEKLQEKMTE
jgi:Zn-dependent protease with chaperone function